MTITTKQNVRRAFNIATTTYDTAADWQKTVGHILLDYIDEIQPNQKTILDLGVGTHFLTEHLLQRYPDNHFIALDIAEQMLLFQKQSAQQALTICGDAEQLCLQPQSIDIIMSNMMLQWCDSLTKAVDEQYQALKKNGLFIFSTLGNQSLQALRNAWRCIDHHSHVNSFPDAAILKQTCNNVGFTLLHFERHEINKQYDTVYDLMNHLKATGARNISTNKPKGLMGKQKMKRLNEQYRNPLIYEVFTITCQK